MGLWDDIKSVGGAVVGGVAGFAVGGPAGAYAGAQAGSKLFGGSSEPSGSTSPAPAPGPDYNGAMTVASNNSKAISLAQFTSSSFRLQQAAADRESQRAANLTLSLEKFDTRMQTSKLQFQQQMTAQENRHLEKMAEMRDKSKVFLDGFLTSDSPDLPPPEDV